MLHASADSVPTSPMLTSDVPDSVSSSASNPFDQYKVIRRNGSVVVFEPAKISTALTKAFIAVNGGQDVPVDGRNDRPQEGEELFRNPCHRISNRWRVVLGLALHSQSTRLARNASQVAG